MQQVGNFIWIFYLIIIKYIHHFYVLRGFRTSIIIMASQPTSRKLEVLLKSSFVGALRSVVSLPFEHPFDALKTNMQAHQTDLRTKGWRGFYNGFHINIFRVMIKQAYRWPLWISIQSAYKEHLPNTNELVRQTITGFTISLCELVIISPFERVKVWLMTTSTQKQAKIRHYYMQKSTLKDLYTGFLSLLIRQGLSWSSFLASTEIVKNMIKQYKGTQELTPTDLFLSSLPVSIINTAFIMHLLFSLATCPLMNNCHQRPSKIKVISMPIDCIKTFYQKYEMTMQKEPFLKTIIRLHSKYGLRGLQLGWSARMIQYTIQSAFTLIVIEDLLRQYKGKSS